MLDINIHVTDTESLEKIEEKLDKIITLLEEKDDEVKGLDQIINKIDGITQQIKKIV